MASLECPPASWIRPNAVSTDFALIGFLTAMANSYASWQMDGASVR